MANLLEELKRRNVIRVAIFYVVAAWLHDVSHNTCVVITIAATTSTFIGVPMRWLLLVYIKTDVLRSHCRRFSRTGRLPLRYSIGGHSQSRCSRPSPDTIDAAGMFCSWYATTRNKTHPART